MLYLKLPVTIDIYVKHTGFSKLVIDMITWIEITIRLSLAAGLGAIIGLERERKDWTAGMRTHMLVCVGAALTMIVSAYGFSDILNSAHVTLDPSRIAAQVISGIGFIGAGTILFLKQGVIRGLTTAAGLWTVAAIGLATGGGLYFAAALATSLALVILWILQPIEKKLSKRFRHKDVKIIAAKEASPSRILKKILQTEATDVSNFSFDQTDDEFIIEIKFDNINSSKLADIVETLQKDTDIKQILWNK